MTDQSTATHHDTRDIIHDSRGTTLVCKCGLRIPRLRVDRRQTDEAITAELTARWREHRRKCGAL